MHSKLPGLLALFVPPTYYRPASALRLARLGRRIKMINRESQWRVGFAADLRKGFFEGSLGQQKEV